MHRQSRGFGGFFRTAWRHSRNAGHQLDNFFRHRGSQIRDVAAIVAPLLAAEAPALAAGVATVGQGAASYSALRDALDKY